MSGSKTSQAEKRALIDAIRFGDLKAVNDSLGIVLQNEGSAAGRSELLNKIRVSDSGYQMSLGVLAIRNLKTRKQTQFERVEETTNADNAYAAGANRIQEVQSLFGEKELKEHIKTRLQIVQVLQAAGISLLPREGDTPTFLEAAGDVQNKMGEGGIVNFNGDPALLAQELQEYSRRLVAMVAQAQNDEQTKSQRMTLAERQKLYSRNIRGAKGDATGNDARHPLIVSIEYGTADNVRNFLQRLFEPTKDSAYVKINYPSANAMPEYIPKKDASGTRNKLSPLMITALLKAVELWSQTKHGDIVMRPLTERIMLLVVRAITNRIGIGNVDVEGWNVSGQTVMDQLWSYCSRGLREGGLDFQRDFRDAGAGGAQLLNDLSFGTRNNPEFAGLRFTPSPPGQGSLRRLLTERQEKYCANIKSQILNAANIRQEDHANWIWCCIKEDTFIYEQSNYFTSRQSIKQTLTKYDSQGINRGSMCLCHYGGFNNDPGECGIRLNYSIADWFATEKYCRVIRAWDYIEFERDDSVFKNISLGGMAGGVAATTMSYFMPSLLLDASFLSALVAGGGLTYVALQEWMRDNQRIIQGYIDTSKLAHRYNQNQDIAARGEGYGMRDPGELALSYVYDSYKAAGSDVALRNLQQRINRDFNRRLAQQDTQPSRDPNMMRQAAEAIQGTANRPNSLTKGNLVSATPRASRTNFTVIKK